MIVSPGELWALASGKRRGLKLNDVALKRGACEMEQDQLQTEGAAAVTKAGAASQAGPLFSGEVCRATTTPLSDWCFLVADTSQPR